MRDVFIIESEGFNLSLDFHVYESDISYPANTNITISVSSDCFSASSSFEYDIKYLPSFCNDLEKIYDSLQGSAKIHQRFSESQYISFSGDRIGHVLISGNLSSNGKNGFWQELKFENSIDQTIMRDFIIKLKAFSHNYEK